MNLILILFLLFYSCNGYTYHQKIFTKFNKKEELYNCLLMPKFYYEYLEEIEADRIIFNPVIKNNNTQINFPQEITYHYLPKFKYVPSFILKNKKIKINQIWDKTEGEFNGKIKTKFMDINLKMYPKLYDLNYILCFEGTITRKKSILIPDKCLDEALKDFCKVFIKITNCTKINN